MYDSRAIRVEDWLQVRDVLVKDGWQFRNQLGPKKDMLFRHFVTHGDTDQIFWSSDGEPDVRQGVVYVRRLGSGFRRHNARQIVCRIQPF